MSLLATAATFVQAQSPTATASDKSVSAAIARNDVYHVYFGKAAPGKAAQMADMLKTPNPKDPMPGHFVLLRHQEGDSWDYSSTWILLSRNQAILNSPAISNATYTVKTNSARVPLWTDDFTSVFQILK